MLDALGINLVEILFTMANFLILIAILAKFLYKPFLGILEKRKQTIQDAFDNAEAINRRADEKMKNYTARVANVEEEGRKIIAEAKATADAQAQLIIEDAHKQASEIMAKAEKNIELEQAKAREDMRKEIAMLAMLAAERIVEHEISNVGQETIVDDVIRNARETGWQN